MNILAAATIDLINHLRKVTKGWRIDPLVQSNEEKVVHRDYISVVRPPTNESFTHFFAAHQPINSRYSLIRIKVPNHSLRLIQCELDLDGARPKVILRYFRANGFRQNTLPIEAYHRRMQEFDYNKCLIFRTYLIERVTKGTKNKGRKRRGTLNIIHRDIIDIGDPGSSQRIAPIVKAMVEKSFVNKRFDDLRDRYARLAVVVNGDNFEYEDEYRMAAIVIESDQ